VNLRVAAAALRQPERAVPRLFGKHELINGANNPFAPTAHSANRAATFVAKAIGARVCDPRHGDI